MSVAAQIHIFVRLCLKGIMDGVPAARDYKGGLKVKDMMNHLAAAVGSGQMPRPTLPMSTQALELYKQVLCGKPSLACSFLYGLWRCEDFCQLAVFSFFKGCEMSRYGLIWLFVCRR